MGEVSDSCRIDYCLEPHLLVDEANFSLDQFTFDPALYASLMGEIAYQEEGFVGHSEGEQIEFKFTPNAVESPLQVGTGTGNKDLLGGRIVRKVGYEGS